MSVKGLKQLKCHLRSEGYNVSCLDEAIEALENKGKYEKALFEACMSLAENEICPVKDCPTAKLSCGEDNEPQCYGDNCNADIFVDYFKNKVGFGVINNE